MQSCTFGWSKLCSSLRLSNLPNVPYLAVCTVCQTVSVKVKIVGEAQSNRTIGLNLVNIISGGNPTQQQEALKRLKSLYSDNKAIKDATVKTDKAYLVHLINVAAIQEDAAGKEKNTQQILAAAYAERRKIEAQRNEDLKNAKTVFGGSAGYNEKKAALEKKRINDQYAGLLASLDATIANAKTKNAELLNTLTNIETPTPDGKAPPKPKKDKTLPLKEAQDLIRQINKTNKLLTPLEEVIGGDTAIEDLKKQHEDYLKWLTGWTKWKEKLAQDNIDNENKKLEELNKSYEQFANTISETVTGAIFSMYDAMQEGASATEALDVMFQRLVRQLAEMAIKAAIFAGIMSAISGGAAGGGISFGGALKKILGLADGGIATGPTLAMIGEGSESEAVLPLSKLGNIMQSSFNAGSMSGYGGGNGGGVAVLRGQDLLIALNRTQKASSLKGQNISLA